MNMKPMTTAILASLITVAGFNASAGNDDTRLECKTDTLNGAASMSARYEARTGKKTRQRFRASYETAPGFGLKNGDVLQVNVNGSVVGRMTLANQVNGDLGGEMDFDTNIDRDDPDTTVPFPPNWTGAAPGTVVMVGTLGCSLQD